MIDIETELLLTLGEVAQRLPKRPHLATVYRWISRGVGGVKLEAIRVGGRLFTSVQAMQRFAEACSQRDSRSSTQTSRRREYAIREAEQELDDAGI